jgi:hypothetical protein
MSLTDGWVNHQLGGSAEKLRFQESADMQKSKFDMK